MLKAKIVLTKIPLNNIDFYFDDPVDTIQDIQNILTKIIVQTKNLGNQNSKFFYLINPDDWLDDYPGQYLQIFMNSLTKQNLVVKQQIAIPYINQLQPKAGNNLMLTKNPSYLNSVMYLLVCEDNNKILDEQLSGFEEPEREYTTKIQLESSTTFWSLETAFDPKSIHFVWKRVLEIYAEKKDRVVIPFILDTPITELRKIIKEEINLLDTSLHTLIARSIQSDLKDDLEGVILWAPLIVAQTKDAKEKLKNKLQYLILKPSS